MITPRNVNSQTAAALVAVVSELILFGSKLQSSEFSVTSQIF